MLFTTFLPIVMPKIIIFVSRRTTVTENQLLSYLFQFISSNKFRFTQTH